MTARKRGGHFANGRRNQGRQARVEKQSAEAFQRGQQRDARKRAEMALSDAQRRLRTEEKAQRAATALQRQQDRAEREARDRRIFLLRREVADRQRELAAYAGVMVMVPAPEPARAVRRKSDEQGAGWGRRRSAPRRSMAELRRLNGLD